MGCRSGKMRSEEKTAGMPPLMRVFAFASLPAENEAGGPTPFTSTNIHSAITSARAFRSPDPAGPVPGASSPVANPPNRACRLRPEARVGGCAMCRWPMPVPVGSGARLTPEQLPSPEGVCHSLLPVPALPATGFGHAVPPVPGFGRFRHLRVSENAHKPLTF